jgi:hypothetical protein
MILTSKRLHLEGALQAMVRFTWELIAAAVVCAAPLSSAAEPTLPVAAPVPKDDGKVRKADAMQRARSKHNLSRILIAIYNYYNAAGHFPQNVVDRTEKPLLSWRVLLLPYLEERKLYRQFKLDEPWDGEHNKQLLARMPDVYRVGFEPKDETKTYYQGFAGKGTLFEPGKQLKFDTIRDGTANTIAVVEAGPPVEWTKPTDFPYDSENPLPKLEGPFSNVLMAVTANGAAYALRRDIDEKDLRSLIDSADGGSVKWDNLKANLPVTAEELEAAKKILAQNEKLQDDLVAELKAQQKLMLELAKQPGLKDAGKHLEEISDKFRSLKEELEEMKRETERLKKQLEEAKK